jgi:hypothetical protein
MQFEIKSAKNVAYVSFLVLTTVLVVYATILLFDKVTIIDKAFGQLPASSSLPSSPISIKIVHPDYGQITNVKNKLEISGESRYNPSYTCQVSVIINDVKPYQKTTPTGDGIQNDYSTWKYTINPDYTTIRNGDNRITARLICTDDVGQDVRKWYSVNVIGQTDTEDNYRNQPKNRMISILADTGSIPAGISPATIEIDRNTFMELINNRLRNDTEAIRDTIEDSIMHVYSGKG